ncbi:MAG: hypothetical protein ABI346_08285 [Candidatus Baltobacteraceae bacterium]
MNKFIATLIATSFLATGSAMAATPKAHHTTHATKHVAVAHKKAAAKHASKKTSAKKAAKHVKVVKAAKSTKAGKSMKKALKKTTK